MACPTDRIGRSSTIETMPATGFSFDWMMGLNSATTPATDRIGRGQRRSKAANSPTWPVGSPRNTTLAQLRSRFRRNNYRLPRHPKSEELLFFPPLRAPVPPREAISPLTPFTLHHKVFPRSFSDGTKPRLGADCRYSASDQPHTAVPGVPGGDDVLHCAGGTADGDVAGAANARRGESSNAFCPALDFRRRRLHRHHGHRSRAAISKFRFPIAAGTDAPGRRATSSVCFCRRAVDLGYM